MDEHEFKKEFGQNFFLDQYWPEKLVEAAGITAADTVLEIGPGDGKVTEVLLSKAKQVIALEIDEALIPVLKAKFKDNTNFELILADVLQFDLASLKLENYKVVGSLPYNISKKIIMNFLETENPPISMTFVIQKEVAEDYASQATKASFLANYAQIFSDLKIVEIIPKDEFYPEPKVDGAIVVFENIKPKFEQSRELAKFIKKSYINPRKKLSSNLATLGFDKQTVETWLTAKGLTATARASELTIEQWHDLAAAIKAN